MKTIFLSLLFLMCITLSTQAQEVRIGAKGGVNFSTFNGDGFEAFNNPEARTSFHIGGFVEIPITEKFWIQPEVMYSGQGFDLVSRDNADDTEVQLDYINVPVMAKFYLIDGLFLEAGPQLGFNVKNEVDSDPDDIGEGDVTLDEDLFNDVDFAIGFGAGYRLDMGLYVGARYTIGMSEIFNNEDIPGPDIDAKNSVVAISLGYSF